MGPAAYMVNGGCCDDGFDYFRGWLIAQGRNVFERAVPASSGWRGRPQGAGHRCGFGEAEPEVRAFLAARVWASVEAAGAAVEPMELCGHYLLWSFP
ncbi:DUF4240 domain-containing protein [Streptomyces sp. NPDC056549]|uniref:DUF4240 domain-containing protein n=1 Tax=Streptomyces sp. NPDC056549 TaxID=3345864 RepID=UPI0036B99EA2